MSTISSTSTTSTSGVTLIEVMGPVLRACEAAMVIPPRRGGVPRCPSNVPRARARARRIFDPRGDDAVKHVENATEGAPRGALPR